MATDNIITLGLSKIEIGDIAVGGGMGTSLATLGYTFEDTCKMTQEDPTITEFRAEELDEPVKIKQKKGKVNFTFSIMNPGIDTLVATLGGTKGGTDPNFTWEAPSTTVTIEQSVKITPSEGLIFSIARGYITAKINAEFSKTGLFMIDVTVTPLVPSDGTSAPISAAPIAD